MVNGQLYDNVFYCKHIKIIKTQPLQKNYSTVKWTARVSLFTFSHSHQWIYFQPSIAWQWWCNSQNGTRTIGCSIRVRNNPIGAEREMFWARGSCKPPPALGKTKTLEPEMLHRPAADCLNRLMWWFSHGYNFYFLLFLESISGRFDVSLLANWLAIDWCVLWLWAQRWFIVFALRPNILILRLLPASFVPRYFFIQQRPRRNWVSDIMSLWRT